jgi:predicted secreted protein
MASEFINASIRRMKYYKELGEKTFEQLNDEDFHFQPFSESNSIAVMIQHIVGNMLSRFTNFITEDGEKDWRNRDGEFEVHNNSKQQLIDLWNKGWKCFFDAVESLTENDLLKTITIRKEELTITDAIIRQLAHYPYHIGQIVYVGRLIKNENWKNLSIPKGHSHAYNQSSDIKDPAKKF